MLVALPPLHRPRFSATSSRSQRFPRPSWFNLSCEHELTYAYSRIDYGMNHRHGSSSYIRFHSTTSARQLRSHIRGHDCPRCVVVTAMNIFGRPARCRPGRVPGPRLDMTAAKRPGSRQLSIPRWMPVCWLLACLTQRRPRQADENAPGALVGDGGGGIVPVDRVGWKCEPAQRDARPRWGLRLTASRRSAADRESSCPTKGGD